LIAELWIHGVSVTKLTAAGLGRASMMRRLPVKGVEHFGSLAVMRVSVVLIVSTVLSGCAPMMGPTDPASPFFAVPVGSVLSVHEPLEIPPGRTRIWFQGGRATYGHNWYAPACNLEVSRLDRNHAQTVDPGRFTVRRVQQMMDRTELAPIRAPVSMRVASVDADSISYLWLGFHLWLENPEQPNVLRLTCIGEYATAWQAVPPSVNEIRTALGRFASLELPWEQR